MSTSPQPPPATPASGGPTPFWRLSRRTWLLIGAAFAAGLLLFLLLWSGKREHDFFRVAPTASPAGSEEYEPLPAPLPADQSARPPAAEAEEAPSETPKIVERAPAPPPSIPTPPASRTTAPPLASGPAPVPIETPMPRYPAQAARRGLGGTVRVRADVGADGVPTAVAVVQGSGMRELDRAALDAVRRWRFRPGQVDGKPVPGSVVVPIEFALRR
ncbi:TonB family protein [Luteimonas sp. SX5]|uniref:Protein TonB n=1 Tax=Luteimonas galliterrae TaxID=2940486 RepID=A0ABT0MFA2_9GAMM|nr:energy transducer TonB [Luteimonas galliterrae]MCL1633549.1 TonB family protein [Luteimonas galliterrae]